MIKTLRSPLFDNGPVISCPIPQTDAWIPVSQPTNVKGEPWVISRKGSMAQRTPSLALFTRPAHVIFLSLASLKLVCRNMLSLLTGGITVCNLCSRSTHGWVSGTRNTAKIVAINPIPSAP